MRDDSRNDATRQEGTANSFHKQQDGWSRLALGPHTIYALGRWRVQRARKRYRVWDVIDTALGGAGSFSEPTLADAKAFAEARLGRDDTARLKALTPIDATLLRDTSLGEVGDTQKEEGE